MPLQSSGLGAASSTLQQSMCVEGHTNRIVSSRGAFSLLLRLKHFRVWFSDEKRTKKDKGRWLRNALTVTMTLLRQKYRHLRQLQRKAPAAIEQPPPRQLSQRDHLLCTTAMRRPLKAHPRVQVSSSRPRKQHHWLVAQPYRSSRGPSGSLHHPKSQSRPQPQLRRRRLRRNQVSRADSKTQELLLLRQQLSKLLLGLHRRRGTCNPPPQHQRKYCHLIRKPKLPLHALPSLCG